MSEFPAGVRALGAYLPRLRVTADELERGWGRDRGGITRAVPDADEDALTMAVAAGRRALSAAETAGETVDGLLFATTTPPVEEGALTTRLGAALDVPESARRAVYATDAASGVRALRAATERETHTLVVAADCPRGAPDGEQEAVAGAGAAAFVVAPDGSLRVTAAAEDGSPAPGTRFRPAGSDETDGVGITAYDRAALRRALSAAAAGVDTAVEAAAVQAPDAGTPYRGADALGVERETVAAGTVVDGVGDAGAASVPLSVALTLGGVDPLSPTEGGDEDDAPGTLLAAGYGGDGAALLRLERTGAVPTAVDARPPRDLDFGDYVRRRTGLVSGAPEGGGAHVSVPAWRRSIPQRYRLVAERCPDCGTVAHPPGGACGACGSLVEGESVTLAREGEVETASRIAQGGAPPEFTEYQGRIGGDYTTAVASFPAPGGGRASVPLLVVDDGREEGAPTAGDPVEAVFRRIYTQAGVTRYGTKLRPL